MKLGLLGAIGGLGDGLSYAGKSMFDRELEMDRERRLQAIRDKEYARARQDAVSDMGRREAFDLNVLGQQQRFRTSERIAGETFSSGQAAADRAFRLKLTEREESLRKELARISLGGLKAVEQDSEGTYFAIDGNGNATPLTDMEGSPYTFGDLAKVYQSTISGINNDAYVDEELDSAKAFASSLEAAMSRRIGIDGEIDTFSPLQEQIIQQQMTGADMTRQAAIDFLRNDPRGKSAGF